jgi:hypothetical protein
MESGSYKIIIREVRDGWGEYILISIVELITAAASMQCGTRQSQRQGEMGKA